MAPYSYQAIEPLKVAYGTLCRDSVAPVSETPCHIIITHTRRRRLNRCSFSAGVSKLFFFENHIPDLVI